MLYTLINSIKEHERSLFKGVKCIENDCVF